MKTLNTNRFYTDYSFGEFPGFAIIKFDGGYVICSVTEREDDKVRVTVENIRIFSQLRWAMAELEEWQAKRAATSSPKLDILSILGLESIESVEQIKTAFRRQVKAAADGRGNYQGDMDNLVKAKEEALQMIEA